MSEESESLTEEQKADARSIFNGEVEGVSACWHCGGIHARVAKLEYNWQPCPRVRCITRSNEGSILSVEYWPNGQWESDIVFPGQVF